MHLWKALPGAFILPFPFLFTEWEANWYYSLGKHLDALLLVRLNFLGQLTVLGWEWGPRVKIFLHWHLQSSQAKRLPTLPFSFLIAWRETAGGAQPCTKTSAFPSRKRPVGRLYLQTHSKCNPVYRLKITRLLLNFSLWETQRDRQKWREQEHEWQWPR